LQKVNFNKNTPKLNSLWNLVIIDKLSAIKFKSIRNLCLKFHV